MKKKIAIIGTNGIPAKYGGFETLAEHLTRYLNEEYDICVYCAKTPRENRLKSHNNSKLKYLPFKANGWQSMIYDSVSIIHALFTVDVLVILGFSGVFAFPFKALFNKKIIFNIGGVEWKKVRGNKLFGVYEVIIKKFFEWICIRFSDVVIVDNQILWNYVNEVYHKECVLAEYGGDHAIAHPVTEREIKKYPFLAKRYDLTVSRAQEDMNIHLLIDAYKKIPNRNLVVVSNWNSSDYGVKLIEENRDKYPNIYLQDAVYDLEELNAIRSHAEIYIHTHSLCGTAPSLVEAMSLGLPVVCFDVDTNRETTENNSLYFSDSTTLKSILYKIDNYAIVELGKNMLKIAKKRYSWHKIVSIYKDCIDTK